MEKEQPKYAALAQWIREKVEKGELRPGDKLYSENQLSDMFHLSRQTVRQAVGVLQREGLLERRRGSGTYLLGMEEPPRKPTKTIGVVTTYLNDYIFPSIVQGIEEVLTQAGYSIQLMITYNKTENEARALRSLLEKDVDGLIIEPSKSALPNLNRALYDKIQRKKLPCLFINGFFPDMGFPCVALDDYEAGRIAAQYLLARGHTQIGGIFKSDDIQGHLRYSGYAQALLKNGQGIRGDNILWYVTEDVSQIFEEEDEGRILQRLGGCTAAVCYNDQIALRLMELLRRHGYRLPKDFSLVSFDNSELASMSGLASVDHPKEVLGQAAARGMLELLRDPALEVSLRYPPKLVKRGSVSLLTQTAL